MSTTLKQQLPSSSTMGINDKTTTSSLSNEYTQSRDVWYSDGSLIIVTEALAFRVHTTIMAAHCEIFRDMVNMPQPKDSDDTGEKTYEGCPVLELQDPAIEMRHFLKAIYEFSSVQPRIMLSRNSLLTLLTHPKVRPIESQGKVPSRRSCTPPKHQIPGSPPSSTGH